MMNRPMTNPTITIVLVILISVVLARHLAFAESDVYLDEKALISTLRKGGFNLYFRHEKTDWAQGDHVQQVDDWISCDGSKIRQLSEVGRHRAEATGEAIKRLGIPIGRILASPYCRTVDTARLMNLGIVEATNDVINLRVAEYFGGQPAVVATAKRLLSTPPESGKNNIIVAHGNVARNATPVYPDEGEGVIFRPDSDKGFVPVGRLKHKDWLRLSEDLSND